MYFRTKREVQMKVHILKKGTVIVSMLLSIFAFGCGYQDAGQSAGGSIDSVNRAATIVVDKVNGPYTTITAGLNAAVAGDTVQVKAGTYNEAVVFPNSGTASAYITLQGDSGAIIDGSTGVSSEILVTINGKSYVKLIGFEIRNRKKSGSSYVPMGVYVSGGGSNIEIRNNKVWGIENTNTNGNAHGIAVYGDSSTAISNIIIDGNQIYSCKLGWSESMVLNGNVNGFTVSNNIVHDNNNIGIDFIGFEGTCGTASLDQARNGTCVGNTVYNITSASNPSYGGETAADGIYVDGGKSIVIERNKVDKCDIGIELASEHQDKATDNITIRNNFVSRSIQGNIQMGGYDSNKGNATNITVVNNTTYQSSSNELVLQFNTTTATIKNNIFVAKSGLDYLAQWGSNNSGITVNNNIYYGASTSSPGAWADSAARYTNPLLVNGYTDMHIQSSSPAIGAGVTASYGSFDIDGDARVNGTVEIGADEYGSVVVPTYTITASAGSNGSISPTGSVTVNQGANQTFTITPNLGYTTSSILVDGVSQTIASTYTFTNVQAAHTISASFAAIPTYAITASAGTGGSISPSGSVSVTQGSNQTFTITPNSGYSIASILVDGVSKTIASTYTFTNVQAAHSISVTFVQAVTYTITSSAGTGGSISPSGSVVVAQGANQTFTITPNSGYTTSSILVDGVSQTIASTYTFTNVQAAHSISASFTASSSTFNVGYTTIGSSTDSGNANYLKAMKVTLSTSAVIQSLSMYTKTAGGKLTLAIYTDSSGTPGTLVATTASITPVAKSWNTTQTTTHPTLAAGTYWLVFETNNNTQTQSYVTSSVACKYRSFTYGTMPSSFGTATTDWKVNYSLYATLQ